MGFSRRVRKALTESVNEFPVDKEIPERLQEHCKEAVIALVNRSISVSFRASDFVAVVKIAEPTSFSSLNAVPKPQSPNIQPPFGYGSPSN